MENRSKFQPESTLSYYFIIFFQAFVLHQDECTIVIKLCVNYVNNQYIHCMRCHKVRGRGRYMRDIVSRRGHFSK